MAALYPSSAAILLLACIVVPLWPSPAHAEDSRRIIAEYGSGQAQSTLPAQSLAALAQAYRDEQQWDRAIALYQAGERRFPTQNVFRIGHIMTLSDARRTDEAIQLGRALVARSDENVDARLALGYAYHMDGQPYPSLAQASKAYALAPHKAYVVEAYVVALQRAGLPQAARREALAHPGVLDPQRLRQLQADVAAQLTRVAATASRGEAERYVVADRALALYGQLIPQWQALGPPAQADLLRAQADQLLALHARGQMKELLAHYEALQEQSAPVPDYVLAAVGDAYLSQRQPEKAVPLLRQALAAAEGPNGPASALSIRTTLFYALIESGDFEAADAVLDPAVAAQPMWIRYKGNPVRQPNEQKVQADLTRAAGDLYEGQTLAAQQKLDQMVQAAPDNAALRMARAQAYRARDLPRYAERDLKIAEAGSPRSIDLEISQAETALALQEWHQLRLLLDDVLAREPENLAAQRLARAWDVHNMYELQMSVGGGTSSDSPVSGSRDRTIDAVVYSPPLNENWRVFAGSGYAAGDFPEGSAQYRYARAGAQWRGRDLTAQAEVSSNRFADRTRTGAAVSASLDLNDHWQVGGAVGILARETPLRALNNDITANRLMAYLRWRGDERREWKFSVAASDFSDGNHRIEADLSGRQRLATTPTLKLDALLELSASRNTLEDAPYFNPASDVTVVPALRLTHTLYRRYETQWEQQLLFGAGAYSQQGHGTGALVTVGYGQRFRYNSVLDLGFLVSSTSRPYDGQRERDLNVIVDMTYRF